MTISDTFDFAMESVVHALGEPVTYTRDGLDPVTVEAVIGTGFERVQSGEIRVSSSKPEIAVRSADFAFSLEPVDVRGDVVVFGGLTFEVANSKGDIEGVSRTLVLKRTG